MNITLIVNAEEFWANLEKDISEAQKKICIQMMTFEGDAAGLKLAEAVIRSGADEKRILVDEYTKHVINDRFIYIPGNMRDPVLQAEIKRTKQMFTELVQKNVGVKWTNPAGCMLRNFPRRNHKKIFLVDDVVYLGGFNFSDHNFSWHDMMVRIEDRAVAEFVYKDFMATWNGTSQAHYKEYEDLSIHFLNGNDNPKKFRTVLNLIDQAQKEILVISPYISFPFVDHLQTAAARDVDVKIITPDDNNKKRLQAYLIYECRDDKIKLYLYKGMFHLKGMLIDNACLVMGSSNFDYISYRVEEEVLLYIQRRDIIADFRKKVFEKDLVNSKKYSEKPSWLIARLHNFLLKRIVHIAIGISNMARKSH